jgi:hypothetical protein
MEKVPCVGRSLAALDEGEISDRDFGMAFV